jgi:hypothetical protein
MNGITRIDFDSRTLTVDGNQYDITEFVSRFGELSYGWLSLYASVGPAKTANEVHTPKKLPSLAVENISSYCQESQCIHYTTSMFMW